MYTSTSEALKVIRESIPEQEDSTLDSELAH